jgi:hypothetical protein
MANGNGNGGGNSAVLAVLIVVVIAIVAWFAYNQGYLGGKEKASPQPTTIQISLPGTSSSPTSSPRY